MHEIIILFIYHRNDKITRSNYASIKQSNPNTPIATICCGTNPITPECFILSNAKFDMFSASRFKQTEMSFLDIIIGNSNLRDGVWYGLDAVIYTWFINKSIFARRYLILEWDCLCTTRIAELYSRYWDCAVAATEHHTYSLNPNWFWFHNDQERTEHLGKIEGLAPIAGTLFSHETLDSLIQFFRNNSSRYNGVFSEIRLGTALKELGIAINLISPSDCHMISPFLTINRYPKAPGLYHPIKYQKDFFFLKMITANLLEKWRRIIWKLRKSWRARL